MDVIGHNYKMIHRNCRVISGNIFDTLPHNHAQFCQWNIVRAINDRPYIHPEQIFAFFCADSYEIGIGCTVIIFCQSVPLSLWQFHRYHLLRIFEHNSRNKVFFQGRTYSPPAKTGGQVRAAIGRPYIVPFGFAEKKRPQSGLFLFRIIPLLQQVLPGRRVLPLLRGRVLLLLRERQFRRSDPAS